MKWSRRISKFDESKSLSLEFFLAVHSLYQMKIAIEHALRSGLILPTTAENLARELDRAGENSLEARVISELLEKKLWAELNDRFFRELSFGTGGLRGRTISRVVTQAERGNRGPDDRPEHPAVGTNMMNFTNIERATRGLCRYVASRFPAKRCSLVIAHDVRHFSREFCEFTARIASNEGFDVYVFDGERSTPMLSFVVRQLRADCGVVITASHNPPHDNGYKAYFNDGAQLVEPEASGVINAARSVAVSGDTSQKNGAKITTLGSEIEEEYLKMLATLPLSQALSSQPETTPRVVFSAIHGTGARAIPAIFERLRIKYEQVPEQSQPDGFFSTVKSPNPENGEALSLGVALAQSISAGIVIGTDPDADRMGVAVRTKQGDYVLLTGNQIASLLAYHRCKKLTENGVLTSENRHRACLIKTFVTSDLIERIAEKFGVKLINTLTGFKYIAQKLLKYEKAVQQARPDVDYRNLDLKTRLSLQLAYGCFFIFGGEESYGYSGTDAVRDKDANAAAVMMVDLLAEANALGKTVVDYLDDLYSELGYYKEKLGQFVMEGAEGAAKIQKLLNSYENAPPTSFLGSSVVKVVNHAKETLIDPDGDVLPKELMLQFHLANGAKVIVRGSGTEPKIKYYLSTCRRNTTPAPWHREHLAKIKQEVDSEIEELWREVEREANQRI